MYLGMEKGLTASKFDPFQTKRAGLGQNRFKLAHLQDGIARTGGILLRHNPTMAATQVATFGQVKIDSLEWIINGLRFMERH
jgi:hypothetical protein